MEEYRKQLKKEDYSVCEEQWNGYMTTHIRNKKLRQNEKVGEENLLSRVANNKKQQDFLALMRCKGLNGAVQIYCQMEIKKVEIKLKKRNALNETLRLAQGYADKFGYQKY